MAVGKSGRKSHPFMMAVLVDKLTKQLKDPSCGFEWCLSEATSHHCQKYRLGIRRSDPRWVQRVGNHCFDLSTKTIPASNEAIVHKHPAAAGEWMTILARDGGAGGCTNMGKE